MKSSRPTVYRNAPSDGVFSRPGLFPLGFVKREAPLEASRGWRVPFSALVEVSSASTVTQRGGLSRCCLLICRKGEAPAAEHDVSFRFQCKGVCRDAAAGESLYRQAPGCPARVYGHISALFHHTCSIYRPGCNICFPPRIGADGEVAAARAQGPAALKGGNGIRPILAGWYLLLSLASVLLCYLCGFYISQRPG